MMHEVGKEEKHDYMFFSTYDKQAKKRSIIGLLVLRSLKKSSVMQEARKEEKHDCLLSLVIPEKIYP
jgi:hypothetical protein